MHTEEIPISKTVYTEEVYIYTNQFITQKKKDNVYISVTYIHQSDYYPEEVRECTHNR